jgi:hypothetical protein
MFWALIGLAVALGAAVRLAYLAFDNRTLPGGDGLLFHLGGTAWADGHPFTTQFVNAYSPTAEQPPGWTAVLGVYSTVVGDSFFTQQLLGLAVGLVVVVLCGLVGRRYLSPRVGVAAAFVAAIYPGFWLLEANLVAVPAALALLGVLLLEVADLRDRPSLPRSLLVGATCGVLALFRPEQLALVALLVIPILLCAEDRTVSERVTMCGAAIAAAVIVIAPWTIYNNDRFEEPVVLSTNGGATLLAGNCAPFTYSGARLGSSDATCYARLTEGEGGARDQSQLDTAARRAAAENIRDDVPRLPITVAARFGRALAIFHPGQAVNGLADWLGTSTLPAWAWVTSFWLLAALAVVGTLAARRAGAFLVPLLVPLLLVALVIAVTYGDPRFHSPAGLCLVVLAAAGVDRLWWGRNPRVTVQVRDRTANRDATPDEEKRRHGTRKRPRGRAKKLPGIALPQQ